MIFVIFIAAALVVIFAAIQLNKYGDVISQKSTWSGAMVGTLLIGGATSLPELTTSLTAVYIDNADIAVGNMLGSNVFNVLILMVFDFIYRKQKVFDTVDRSTHVPIAYTGLVMTALLAVALLWQSAPGLFNVGIEMYLLVIIYIIVMRQTGGAEDEAEEPTSSLSLNQAIARFIIAALFVFIAGSALAIYGDLIAKETGMSSSFVGSFLIAASTSLPELVTVLAAFRIMNYSLALGSIFGSNLFNLQLLVITDAFYREGAILNAASASNVTVAFLGIAMIALSIFAMQRKSAKHVGVYAIPSALTIVLYFASTYLMF